MSAKSSIKTVSAKAISTAGLQVRASMCSDHVDDIADLFDPENPTWPDDLPPIVVFWDGKVYHDADGHHRLAAASQAGCTEIRVDVRKGSKEDAIRYACGANTGHGLRRTNEDKRNAVRVAYRLNPGATNRAIANICRVSPGMVDYVVKDLRQPKEELPKLGNSDQAGSKLSGVESATPKPAPDVAESGNFATAETESDAVATEASGVAQDAPEPVEPANVPDVEPSVPTDELGVPCQSESAIRAFASLDLFDELERVLSQASRLVNQIGGVPGAELYRTNHLTVSSRDGKESFRSPDLENAIAELAHWKPYTLCPHCLDIPQHDCGCCKGLPYVTKSAWLSAPEKLRAKAVGMKGGVA